jgi:uncharacterized membrane protein
MHRFDLRERRWLLAIAGLGLTFCLGFVAAPWLEHRGIAAGSWLRFGYRPTCHQIPERCLDLGAGPLAVCARCSGLYLGGLLAILWSALTGIRHRPPLGWIALALAPSGVDFVMALAGLPNLENWPRLVVAGPPAFLLGLLLSDAIADVIARIGPPTSPPASDPVQ